jgi:hypothetical protein
MFHFRSGFIPGLGWQLDEGASMWSGIHPLVDKPGATVALVTQPMIICFSRLREIQVQNSTFSMNSESLSFRIQVAGGERRAGYLRSMRPRGMPARTFPN